MGGCDWVWVGVIGCGWVGKMVKPVKNILCSDLQTFSVKIIPNSVFD